MEDDMVKGFKSIGGKINIDVGSPIRGSLNGVDVRASRESDKEWVGIFNDIEITIEPDSLGKEVTVSYGDGFGDYEEYNYKTFPDAFKAWEFFKLITELGEFTVFAEKLQSQ